MQDLSVLLWPLKEETILATSKCFDFLLELKKKTHFQIFYLYSAGLQLNVPARPGT